MAGHLLRLLLLFLTWNPAGAPASPPGENFCTRAISRLLGIRGPTMEEALAGHHVDIYEKIEAHMAMEGREETFSRLISRTSPETLAYYLQVIADGRLTVEQVVAVDGAILAQGLPPFEHWPREHTLFVKAILGEVSPELKQFALEHSRPLARHYPRAGGHLRALTENRAPETRYRGIPDSASLLWYFHRPRDAPGMTTYMALQTGGEVWFHPKASNTLENHQFAALLHHADSFVEFAMEGLSPEQAQRLHYLLEHHRPRDILPCGQGPCRLLQEARILSVPWGAFLAEKIPSLTALYLALQRARPSTPVEGIYFWGGQRRDALASANLVVDGLAMGIALLTAGGLVVFLF